jgi:hypothetical protein
MPTRFDDLLKNPALFRAALEFNALATPPDFGLPQASSLFALLARNPRLWRCFPTVKPRATVWCFVSRPNRLALLPPPLLARFQLYWNAAVWAEDLARIIERKRLSRIMTRIGPEVYYYAVRRGRFQLGGLRALFHQEAQEGKAGGEKAKNLVEADGLMERFHHPGERILALCFAQWPEELCVAWENHWQRARPREVPPADSARFPTFWPWVEKILLQEVAPEWQPCFNS